MNMQNRWQKTNQFHQMGGNIVFKTTERKNIYGKKKKISSFIAFTDWSNRQTLNLLIVSLEWKRMKMLTI